MHTRDAFEWLWEQGYEFTTKPFDDWRWRVLTDDAFENNALYPFATLLEEFTAQSLQLPNWDTTQAVQEFAGTPVTCPPMDSELLHTYFDYFLETGYITPPEKED